MATVASVATYCCSWLNWYINVLHQINGVQVYVPGTFLNLNIRFGAFCGQNWRLTIIGYINSPTMVKIANLALVVFQLFVQYSSGRNIHRRTNRQRREVF